MQDFYAQYPNQGRPGLANSRTTLFTKTSSGDIFFGCAVIPSGDTNVKKQAIVRTPNTEADVASFIGIAAADSLINKDDKDLAKYKDKQTMSIATKGTIWVLTSDKNIVPYSKCFVEHSPAKGYPKGVFSGSKGVELSNAKFLTVSEPLLRSWGKVTYSGAKFTPPTPTLYLGIALVELS